MKNLMKYILFFFILSTLSLYATIRYISKTGNHLSPFITESGASTNINDALAIATKGDIIQILDNGVYVEYLYLDKTNLILQGEADNKPTIKNFPSSGMTIIQLAESNIQLKNLILVDEGSLDSYVVQSGSMPQNNYTFSNCIFQGTGSQKGFGVNQLASATFLDCEFSQLQSGVYLQDVHNIMVKNSYFHNLDYAIQTRNYSQSIEISYSKFYYINTRVLSFSNTTTANPIKIFKNYFYQASSPIYVLDLYLSDFFVFNNTFVQGWNDICYMSTTQLASNVAFKLINNLFYISSSTIANFNISPHIVILTNFNTWHDDPYASFNLNGANSIDNNNHYGDDPQLVDINNLNFALKDTSPCIDAGRDVGLPFSGDAPDIGAYESTALSDRYTNFTKTQIFNENNIEIDNRNLVSDQTAHILIKNLFYNMNLHFRNPIEERMSLRVDVFSLTGEKITTLYNNLVNVNIFQIDLTMSDLNVPSGLYFLRVRSNKFDVTKKFTYTR